MAADELVDLQAGVGPGGDVVVEAGQQPHHVGRAAGAVKPALPYTGAALVQRIYIEEALAVEPDAGQEAVVERALDEVGEPGLAGDEQHPPVPHDRGDRGAGLTVGAVGRQLERHAERLTLVPGSDPAGEV